MQCHFFTKTINFISTENALSFNLCGKPDNSRINVTTKYVFGLTSISNELFIGVYFIPGHNKTVVFDSM